MEKILEKCDKCYHAKWKGKYCNYCFENNSCCGNLYFKLVNNKWRAIKICSKCLEEIKKFRGIWWSRNCYKCFIETKRKIARDRYWRLKR